MVEHADGNSAEAESVPGADTSLQVQSTPAPRAEPDLLSHAASTHAPLPVPSLWIGALGTSARGTGDLLHSWNLTAFRQESVTNSLML